jgi:GNAT superfamily N-acetyltransferase
MTPIGTSTGNGISAAAIIRLDASRDRAALENHFAALETTDLRNRFCSSCKPECIAQYLAGLPAAGVVSYGVFDAELALIAVCQLAATDADLEVGLTVLTQDRRKGLAIALLSRAATYARARGFKALIMHCLADNNAMLALARRIGMAVEVLQGEADGRLKLRAATTWDFWREVAYDHDGLTDAVAKRCRLATQSILRDLTPKPPG